MRQMGSEIRLLGLAWPMFDMVSALVVSREPVDVIQGTVIEINHPIAQCK